MSDFNKMISGQQEAHDQATRWTPQIKEKRAQIRAQQTARDALLEKLEVRVHRLRIKSWKMSNAELIRGLMSIDDTISGHIDVLLCGIIDGEEV